MKFVEQYIIKLESGREFHEFAESAQMARDSAQERIDMSELYKGDKIARIFVKRDWWND